jgi:hypothetical protein
MERSCEAGGAGLLDKKRNLQGRRSAADPYQEEEEEEEGEERGAREKGEGYGEGRREQERRAKAERLAGSSSFNRVFLPI